MFARTHLVSLIACAALLASGCGGCEKDPVPFGLDAGKPATPKPETEPAAFEPQESTALAAGTRSVAVQGAPLAAEGGELRALLPLDADADGDRDALVIFTNVSGVGVGYARRDGTQFAPLLTLGDTLPAGVGAETCALHEAALQTIAEGYAVARIVRTCGEGQVERSISILSVEARPRLRERVVLLPEQGRAAGDVALALRALDQDGDGQIDLVLDVSVKPPDATEAATVALSWLDRPGGLARDTAEPEASLAALAEQAAQSLRGDQTAALALSLRALALHAALCREAGSPRIRVGGTDGIRCGASSGAGRAAAVATAAYAQTGRLFDALRLHQQLSQPAYRVSRANRRVAERALSIVARTNGLSASAGPAVALPSGPATRLSVLAFQPDGKLMIRGAEPRLLDPATGAVEDAPPAGDTTLIRDPSGRFAVTEVFRSCEGYHLRVVDASNVVAGVVAGRPLSTPLVAAQAPPPGASCPALSEAESRDDGGFRVLGWAPQGVVAVRGEQMHVVPLSLEGTPAGEPSMLEKSAPAPAPLPAGAATPTADAYALATSFGVVVEQRGASTTLYKPEGLDPAALSPLDVALSAGRDWLAYVQDGKVYVLRLPR